MLVLSRKRNESIRIFDDIQIMIVDIRGDKVKLGIEAAREIPVHREEVWQDIQRKLPAQQPPAETPPTETSTDG